MPSEPSLKELQNGWTNKQNAHMKRSEDQTLQAALMLAERVGGSTIAEIARRYNVRPDTVTKRLELARRQNLLKGAADQVVETLIPKAQAVYALVLDVDHAEFDRELALKAAKDLMFGSGVLSTANRPQISPDQTDITAKIETLDDYRRLRQAQGKGGVVIEAEILSESDPLEGGDSTPPDPGAVDPPSGALPPGEDGDGLSEAVLPRVKPQGTAGAEEGHAPAGEGRSLFARGVYLS